jgi:hypothetical protein
LHAAASAGYALFVVCVDRGKNINKDVGNSCGRRNSSLVGRELTVPQSDAANACNNHMLSGINLVP